MVGSAPRKVSQTAPLMKVSGLFRDRADGLTFTTDEALDMFPQTDEVKKRAVQTPQRTWRRYVS